MLIFQPPTVHPINLVIEGSSMTILCIAMGTPMPTISLYISGRLVRQETTRHMVTVVHNVTKDMDQISCYADNGYGTPMQASRKITISRKFFFNQVIREKKNMSHIFMNFTEDQTEKILFFSMVLNLALLFFFCNHCCHYLPYYFTKP